MFGVTINVRNIIQRNFNVVNFIASIKSIYKTINSFNYMEYRFRQWLDFMRV